MNLSPLIDRAIIIATFALGGYLLATTEAPTHAELEARKNNVLQAFEPEDIKSLSWTSSEGDVTLRRDDSGPDTSRYLIGKSGERIADEVVVREVISALDFSTWSREVDKDATSKFGFEQPQLEMNIAAGPRSYRLVFGKAAPSPARSIYLKVEGTNVETAFGVVDLEMLEKLKRRAQEFYGGLVFPLGKTSTKSLLLEHEGRELNLTATPSGFMVARVTGTQGAGSQEAGPQEQTTLADRTLLDLVFFQLARAKVSTYLDTGKDTFEPVVSVTQTTREKMYEVDLGGSCPDAPTASILARRKSPEVLLGCVPRSIITALSVSAEEMTAKTASATNPDELDHVIINGEAKSLDIIRQGADYKLLSRKAEIIPQETGDEFFKGFSQTKLLLLETAPDGIEKVGTVALKGQRQTNGSEPSSTDLDRVHEEALEVYRQDEHLYLLRKADQRWLEVPTRAHWFFLPNDEWARDKVLFHGETTSITRVATSSAEGFQQEIQRTSDGFVLSDTKEQADPALTRDVLHELSHLSALRFLSPARPKPQSGLFQIDFDTERGGERKKHTIWLGDRIRGGYTAWSTLSDGTFVFPLQARIPFNTPLRDRRDFRLNTKDFDQIEVTVGKRSFEFQRQAGALRGISGEATDDLAEPLTAALDSLRVVSVAGDHPSTRSMRRGEPLVTVSATHPNNAEIGPITLHFGGPVVWRGASTRLCWIDGSDENYFIAESSLSELLQLL